MHSLSLPWYLSTVFTSTSNDGSDGDGSDGDGSDGDGSDGGAGRVRSLMASLILLCWCLYGVTTPTLEEGTPH